MLGVAAVPRGAEARPNHGGAAMGGAVAGLVCGGGTMVYARLRAGPEGPLLWHTGGGPGWVGVYFLEHGAVGGLTGALGNGPRAGFIIGGAVTCALDITWVIASEILAAEAAEDADRLSFLRAEAVAEVGPDGIRFGVPPIVVTRRGAWAPLLQWRF